MFSVTANYIWEVNEAMKIVLCQDYVTIHYESITYVLPVQLRPEKIQLK